MPFSFARFPRYEIKEIGLVLSGLFGIYFTITWLQETVINPFIWIVVPALLAGISATFRWPKRPGDLYGNGKFAIQISSFVTHSIVIGGFWGCSLLALNRFLPGQASYQTGNFHIISTSSMQGATRNTRQHRRPVFTIDFMGTPKSMVMPHEYLAKAPDIKTIKLSYRVGGLGFRILDLETAQVMEK